MNTTHAHELTESLEDYLEAIYCIIQEKQVARPKDIAARMKVTNASVTGALRTLAERNLIHYAPYDFVTFTPGGAVVAEEIYRRHLQLTAFLRDFLHVEAVEAEKTACKMEHAMSRVIVDKLVRFATFVQNCPRGGMQWLSWFEQQCEKDGSCEHCDDCVDSIVDRIQIQREENTQQDENAAKDVPEVTLATLPAGERGMVARLDLPEEALSRVREMGITPGTLVEVERVAPWGDPIFVYVAGQSHALKKDVAQGVVLDMADVEVLTPIDEI